MRYKTQDTRTEEEAELERRDGGLVTGDDVFHRGHVLLKGADEGELVAAAVEVVIRPLDFEIPVALQVVC